MTPLRLARIARETAAALAEVVGESHAAFTASVGHLSPNAARELVDNLEAILSDARVLVSWAERLPWKGRG